MALQFLPGQVAVGDPSPIGPTALSGPVKDAQVKVVRLTSANFTTTGVNTLVAVLPADASILGFRFWVKTVLSGNGVTSPTASIGASSAGTDYTSALAITNTAGKYFVADPVTGIVQNYQIPLSGDLNIWFRGACSTGNPTAGEIYLLIDYIR